MVCCVGSKYEIFIAGRVGGKEGGGETAKRRGERKGIS